MGRGGIIIEAMYSDDELGLEIQPISSPCKAIPPPPPPPTKSTNKVHILINYRGLCLVTSRSRSVARFMDLSTICGFWGQKMVCGWIKAKSRVLWIFLLIADFVQLRLSFMNMIIISDKIPTSSVWLPKSTYLSKFLHFYLAC